MRFPALLLTFSLAASVPAAAQTPPDRLTRRQLPHGVSILLPAIWKPASAAARATGDTLDARLSSPGSGTGVLPGGGNGAIVSLMQENEPGVGQPSANLSMRSVPMMVQSMYEHPTKAIASELAMYCPTVREAAKAFDMKAYSCDPPYPDRTAGRVVMVGRYVLTGALGAISFWTVLYAGNGVSYTLTLSAPNGQEARYAPIFRRIWRSVEIDRR